MKKEILRQLAYLLLLIAYIAKFDFSALSVLDYIMLGLCAFTLVIFVVTLCLRDEEYEDEDDENEDDER
mgnify:CR=1 FL=1|jgi:uncharacterized membrane protein YuzA (DUF378 family)